MPSAEDGGKSEAGSPTPNSKASGAAPAAAAPEPETDQWVQCDRCRTWRVVPAQHWPSLEADTSEVSAAQIALWQSMPPRVDTWLMAESLPAETFQCYPSVLEWTSAEQCITLPHCQALEDSPGT